MTYKEMYAAVKKVASDPLLRASKKAVQETAGRTAVAILLSEVVLVIQPYPVKWYFDGILHNLEPSLMYTLCVGMLVVYFIGTELHNRQATFRSELFLEFWCAAWGYAHLRELKLDTAWHVKHSTGDKESIIGRNIYKILVLVQEVVGNTIPSVMRIVLTSIGVWLLGLHIGAVAFVTVTAFILAMTRTERVMGPLRKESHKEERRLEREGTEITKIWRMLKQMGIETTAARRHWRHIREHVTNEHARTQEFNRCWKRQEATINIGRVLLYAACYHWYSPEAGLGSVVLATAWMERIFSNLYRLDEFQRKLNHAREALGELCGIFEIVPVVRQPDRPQWPTGGVRGGFELQGVSFSFPNRTDETLKGLNLTIHPNECLALIGRTGSGKTTLTSLLMREYPPSSGTITLDGIPLDQLNFDRFRRKAISVVAQRFDLVDGTILQNILEAKPEATFEEAIAAAVKAHAHDFIMGLPQGYQTKIGEDGITLSGGQRQRLAIARALIRQPPILIMDEATSSLDGESQAEVQKAIDELIRNRTSTIIVIAHRLSTIRQADRIAVMDEGRIVEIGTPAELAAQGGLYRYFLDRELSDLQFQMEA